MLVLGEGHLEVAHGDALYELVGKLELYALVGNLGDMHRPQPLLFAKAYQRRLVKAGLCDHPVLTVRRVGALGALWAPSRWVGGAPAAGIALCRTRPRHRDVAGQKVRVFEQRVVHVFLGANVAVSAEPSLRVALCPHLVCEVFAGKNGELSVAVLVFLRGSSAVAANGAEHHRANGQGAEFDRGAHGVG